MLAWVVVLSSAQVALAGTDVIGGEPKTSRPAVLAPNIRLEIGYRYLHIDEIRTSFSPAPMTTTVLQIEEVDYQGAHAAIVATIPVTRRFGLRGRVQGSYRLGREGLDLFASGNDDTDFTSYGAAAEIFMRDPEVGSLTIGSSFDRLDSEGRFGSNAIGVTAGAAIFFPDLGSGPVDWFVRFSYTRRDIYGAGSSSDFDSDSYAVRAGAGWYLTPNSELILGGAWAREENEFQSEETVKGSVDLRWLSTALVPIEFSMGGSIGVSKYDQTPFRADHRLIYGANVGFVIRFRSGPTLIEMHRAYD